MGTETSRKERFRVGKNFWRDTLPQDTGDGFGVPTGVYTV